MRPPRLGAKEMDQTRYGVQYLQSNLCNSNSMGNHENVQPRKILNYKSLNYTELTLKVAFTRSLITFVVPGDINMNLFYQPGTAAYERLASILLNTRIVNDIKKLSPHAQTSCLEGYHSLLNHFHPKMLCFSYIGTKCR